MTVVVITPPSPVVSVEEAKLHCRVDDSDTASNSLIETYVAAATAWLDGPAGWLGRALGVQVLEWQSCSWPCDDFRLPYQPLIEVISITYVDTDGNTQTIPVPVPVPDPWSFSDAPATRGRAGDVKIQYRAGYGTSDDADPPVWTNDIPNPIKVAILLLVNHWYENREAVSGSGSPTAIPFGVEALLSTYRVWN